MDKKKLIGLGLFGLGVCGIGYGVKTLRKKDEDVVEIKTEPEVEEKEEDLEQQEETPAELIEE